jgi:hypothetical protein
MIASQSIEKLLEFKNRNDPVAVQTPPTEKSSVSPSRVEQKPCRVCHPVRDKSAGPRLAGAFAPTPSQARQAPSQCPKANTLVRP